VKVLSTPHGDKHSPTLLRLDMRPTILKALVPLVLISVAFTNPDDLLFPFYQILWVPFSYFLRFQPLVCSDKPWFASMWGEAFAAIIWSFLYYFLLSVKFVRTKP
jgi:hypothetical protein